MSAGFVYIIRPRQQLAGDEVIKIGMTTRSIQRRVKELSTGSHAGFDVIYSIRADNARQLESLLHRKFERFRVQGGGQEFFRLPASSVVCEIERIALEVSSDRARSERDKEFKSFKNQIGATSLERRIATPLLLSFPIAWGYLYYYLVVKVGMEVFPRAEWAGLVVALACMYILPVTIWWIGKRLYGVLWDEFVKSRFGSQLVAKDEELRAKYPLAYAKQ
ncbi:MAG: hypothetical protein BGN85_09185 [Alphaproteobacteria bacterium 64-11]|nr:GIY-YIG nuclease family protein [Alphaproteobacteria bacterium]OJU11941.1 MAG: hypothetical protein BGN85_09185 [Alphaproteobacteria bacterium 64-11]